MDLSVALASHRTGKTRPRRAGFGRQGPSHPEPRLIPPAVLLLAPLWALRSASRGLLGTLSCPGSETPNNASLE